MLEALAAGTGAAAYLMAGIGALGILAKIINHFTLYRLVKAAGNMPKSTHRLIKLVRAKYEHACMIHDSVENINAFVEKYIYEYRGFLFRIHTWRQIEVLSVWFAGILAAAGAFSCYLSYGLMEQVYQYAAAGTAEVVLLSVVMRLSDEPYKINAVKMYMVDYLENICAFRLKKQTLRERESIDVISAESSAKNGFQSVSGMRDQEDAGSQVRAGRAGKSVYDAREIKEQTAETAAAGDAGAREAQTGQMASGSKQDALSINIEGEPRDARSGDAARQAVKVAAAKSPISQNEASQSADEQERTALREEAIRQILEEFLA